MPGEFYIEDQKLRSDITDIKNSVTQVTTNITTLVTKSQGGTPVTGSTVGNWQAGEADMVSIGADGVRNKIHDLTLSIHNLVGTVVTVRLYKKVNDVERKCYEQSFDAASDPPGLPLNINSNAVIDDNLDPITGLEAIVNYPRLGQCDGQAALAYTKQDSLYLDRHQFDLSNMASFHLRHFLSWASVYLATAFSEAFLCHGGRLAHSWSAEPAPAVADNNMYSSLPLAGVGRLNEYPIHKSATNSVTRMKYRISPGFPGPADWFINPLSPL